MFVGDRTGTLFRVNAAGRAVPFAILPPSIAAFHLAVGLEEEVYVSGPTLSSRDPIYRVDRRGEVSVFAEGFGRPQGLAVDEEGTLHVADSLAGASGIFRVAPGRPRELVVAGDGVIGLAFHPARGVAVASGERRLRFDRGEARPPQSGGQNSHDTIECRLARGEHGRAPGARARCAGNRRPLCSSSNASPSRICSSTANGPTR